MSNQITKQEFTSNELSAALQVFDIGLGFALCQNDLASTREAVKKLKQDFLEIQALIAANVVKPKANPEPSIAMMYSKQYGIGDNEPIDYESPRWDGFMDGVEAQRSLNVSPRSASSEEGA